MRKIATTLAALSLLAPAAAQAHQAHQAHKTQTPPVAKCPVGVPVQMLTVTNLAHVRATALAAVERATTDQSVQVRAAWGTTPCVQFGPGGWPVILTSGREALPGGAVTYQLGGVHTGPASRWGATAIPTIRVQTGATTVETWARALAHEVVETLQNPAGGTAGAVEIADPVENESATYRLDGLQVTDFVFPSFYSDGPGPWDQAHKLTRGI